MFHDDPFVIADTTFTSRLITGTGEPLLDVLEGLSPLPRRN